MSEVRAGLEELRSEGFPLILKDFTREVSRRPFQLPLVHVMNHKKERRTTLMYPITASRYQGLVAPVPSLPYTREYLFEHVKTVSNQSEVGLSQKAVIFIFV